MSLPASRMRRVTFERLRDLCGQTVAAVSKNNAHDTGRWGRSTLNQMQISAEINSSLEAFRKTIYHDPKGTYLSVNMAAVGHSMQCVKIN